MSKFLIQHALNLHRQGKLGEAEPLYLNALQDDPSSFTALHLLGVLRAQQGRYAEGADLLAEAHRLNPEDFAVLTNYASALMGAHRHETAIVIYDRILAARPDHADARYQRAVALAQLKRFDQALAGFDAVLALKPSAEAWYNRGAALSDLGRFEEAAASHDRALAIKPGLPAALEASGRALWALGRLEQALASYDAAVAALPQSNDLRVHRGMVLARLRRADEALADYDGALALAPDDVLALGQRGQLLAQLGRWRDALVNYDRALELVPDDVTLLVNRGATLWSLQRHEEAVASYDRALAIAPQNAIALAGRGYGLRSMGRLAEALACYDRLVEIAPGDAQGWNSRGTVLHAMNRFGEAIESFDAALLRDPGLLDVLVNRAQLLGQAGALEAALADLDRALMLSPHQPYARGERLHWRMQAADWHDLEAEKNVIDLGVRAGERIVRPFVYQALSGVPADLQACSRIFARDVIGDTTPLTPIAPRMRRRIRIGYVSGEFREQATAHLMAGLYESHDRERFEVIAIDNGAPDGSAMRRRLEKAFDQFIPIAKLSDAAAAAAVRTAGVDILINLNGYFGAPRMSLFARRPAPVQVNYLGFPATLGASCMDYILADHIVIPEADRRYYTEAVVYLPDSYQANDSRRVIEKGPLTRAEQGLPTDAFVFCNFNQAYKLAPDIFAVWMQLLARIEGSVLWLLDGGPLFRTNLRRAAQQHGIAGDRLVFAAPLPPGEHLARLGLANLALDTLPYNSHTTGSDALWAGVPLLTSRGTSFPGRVGASLLTAAGLPELVSETLAEYEAMALHLATNTSALATLKEKLALNRTGCALFDTTRFCRHIEAAFTAMFKTWQAGEAPRSFAVPPSV
jgi:protein O-GlcNAc transferase